LRVVRDTRGNIVGRIVTTKEIPKRELRVVLLFVRRRRLTKSGGYNKRNPKKGIERDTTLF